MECASCGRENRADAAFCDRCGARLLERCPRCERELTPDARFCDGCGAALRALLRRDLGSYTPRHLAEKILKQRSALEGERKQVTVLFVDVKSSLELAEEVDPEEWHHILDRFFQILADGVHRFEGTVNQYTGDGIMALFGAPIAHEDHGQRACYAALHLSRELRRYAQELRRERSLDFQVRMGLNSGEVVVGRIGDDLRMDYTAQGHTVGLASRMEELAETGKAYVSEHTARLVSGYFELEDLGVFHIKGMLEPPRAYALEGLGTHRTRLDVARSRGFSRFVGRERETRVLDEALASAARGGGRVIAVGGTAGVGKSRLCYELLQRSGARVTTGNGVSHGKSSPLLPMLECLRDAFEIGDDDEPSQARKKIAGALLLADRESADDLPLIFDVLGVASPGDPAPLVEGEGRQRRVFSILRRVLEAREPAEAAAEAPAVILLEDLQWFDAASEAFVAELVEGIGDTGTLLLLTYRPEFEAPLLEHPVCQKLWLEPLGPEASDALLEDLLGGEPALDSLRDAIRERARGNPFFIEEVVQSLTESGALLGSRGSRTLARPVEEIAIPETVQSLISARIDRLADREKKLLDTAAVIGKRFAEPILRKVSELTPAALDHAMQVLTQAEIVVEEVLFPERVFAFKHPLTQEVAYQSQLTDRRREVHGNVARALEEADSGSLDERAALIAHHWEQAENTLAAARWVHRAARWIGPSHPVEAMELWRKLMTLVERSPTSAENSFLAARACRWLLFLGASQGMPESEAKSVFRAGREHSERTRDRRSAALALANYGYYRAQIVVDPRSYVEYARQAVAIARETERPELEITLGIRLAQALGFSGRFLEATTLGKELLGRLEAPDAPPIAPLEQVTLYTAVGDSLIELGRPDESLALIEGGLSLAGERGLTLNAGYCHNSYVRLSALTGELERAERHALAAMRAAERTGNKAMRVYAYDVLGLAHQLHTRWPEAVECGERAVELSAREGVARISENAHRAHLAHAYLRAGELSKARSMAQRAVESSERCGPRYTPRAQIVLARVLLDAEGPQGRSRIEDCLDAAQAAVDETDARIYEPLILEDRARLAGLLGDDQRRLALQRAAHGRYVEMNLALAARRLEPARSPE